MRCLGSASALVADKLASATSTMIVLNKCATAAVIVLNKCATAAVQVQFQGSGEISKCRCEVRYGVEATLVGCGDSGGMAEWGGGD
jgi:hypothetical protein